MGRAGRAFAQVNILEARCAGLERQLGELGSAGELFRDLERTHSSVQRKLASARASDGVYNNSSPHARGSPGDGISRRERVLPPTGFM